MPTLTPIPLSLEEHQRLGSIKHKLEANSWREMLMKLCDIYEDYCQTKTNTPPATEEIMTENPEIKSNESDPVDEEPKKEDLFFKLLKPLGKEGKKEVNEEDVRRIIREEFENWRIELPEHEHSHEPKKEIEPCPNCRTPLNKTKKPEYCPNCDEELDWED
ncbi:MAG: autoantigen p27 domain-containing protein [Candidatus Bathyarchaeota archaeon]|nr:autoantigen p27 domain-containing protein [Candidatus Bathyarchaeota archaeon]